MTGAIHPYDDLKAYCDGELTPARRLTVRWHLARCASCREEIRFMQQLGTDLRPDSGAATLDPDLRERVLAEAANTPLESLHSKPEITKPRRVPALIFVFGSGLAALFLAALLFPLFAKAREKARQGPENVPVASSPGVDARPDTDADNGATASAPKAKPVPSHMVAERAVSAQSAGAVAAPSPPLAFAPAAPPSPPAALDSIGEDPLRRVHKEATLTVQVADPEAESDDVAQMTRDIGGYVGSNNLSTDDGGAKSAELILNVPEPQFEGFIARVSKLGSVTAKQITGEDVTQKVSDANQAQQVLDDETQRAEARLQQLGRHSKWDDAEEARDLRVRLAQARARLLLLKKMATLSTITVDLTEKPKPPAPVQSGFLPGLQGTSEQALQSLGASVGVLMSLVIWIAAYAPIWIPVLLVGRLAYRKYYPPRNADTDA